jgi:glycosyltransferase involved in cell wall biosynthesis
MSTKPLVSVIIPCYNVSAYIEEALFSVLKQTYDALEIIVVDNNSTDDTVEKIKRMQADYPGIQLLTETSKGASFARNKGLVIAKGKYIQFLDADDLLLPGKIEAQVSLAESSGKNSAVVVGDYKRRSTSGSEAPHKAEKSDPWLALMATKLGITSANLFNREALLDVNGWNANLGSSQEYELMFRLMRKNGEVLFCENSDTIIRDRESGSISLENRAANWERYCQLRAEMLEYIISKHPDQNNQKYRQVLFDAIRIWYKYDKKAALSFFEKENWTDFVPQPSAASSVSYCRLYKILGFRKAQFVLSLLGK